MLFNAADFVYIREYYFLRTTMVVKRYKIKRTSNSNYRTLPSFNALLSHKFADFSSLKICYHFILPRILIMCIVVGESEIW